MKPVYSGLTVLRAGEVLQHHHAEDQHERHHWAEDAAHRMCS